MTTVRDVKTSVMIRLHPTTARNQCPRCYELVPLPHNFEPFVIQGCYEYPRRITCTECDTIFPCDRSGRTYERYLVQGGLVHQYAGWGARHAPDAKGTAVHCHVLDALLSDDPAWLEERRQAERQIEAAYYAAAGELGGPRSRAPVTREMQLQKIVDAVKKRAARDESNEPFCGKRPRAA